MVIRPLQVTGKYKTKVPVAAFDWELFIINDILELWAIGERLVENRMTTHFSSLKWRFQCWLHDSRLFRSD